MVENFVSALVGGLLILVLERLGIIDFLSSQVVTAARGLVIRARHGATYPRVGPDGKFEFIFERPANLGLSRQSRPHSPQYKCRVFLAGSFNGWLRGTDVAYPQSGPPLPEGVIKPDPKWEFQLSANVWNIAVNLKPKGKPYEYKVVVDEGDGFLQWFTDPRNPRVGRYDNSLVTVRKAK
jgi:hypothetical protein